MKKLVIAVFACLLTASSFGCGANEGILKSGKETPVPGPVDPAVSSLERDIDYMRTADFVFIFVLRRKDDGALDAEDKKVIRLQTDQANRRVSSDGGKAVVVGSNYKISPEKMTELYNRFAVENFSRQDNVNGSVNGNTK